MALSFRALNEMDILIDPMKNGIISKIYRDELLGENNIDKNNEYEIKMFFKNYSEKINNFVISKQEKYKNTFKEFLSGKYRIVEREIHTSETKKEYVFEEDPNYNGEISNNQIFWKKYYTLYDAREFFTINKQKNLELYNLFNFFSRIKEHISEGCKINTEFVSTTTDFESLKKYYLSQKICKVAVVESIDNKDMYETNSKNFFRGLSLDSRLSLDHLPYFFNNETKEIDGEVMFKATERKTMMSNNALSDSEELGFGSIAPKNIYSIITPLEMDLLENNVYSEEAIKYNDLLTKKRKNIIETLKQEVLYYDEIYTYIIENHYKECKSLLSLACEKKYKIKDLVDGKKVLINLISQKIFNKMNCTNNIKIPEDVNGCKIEDLLDEQLDLIRDGKFNYFDYCNRKEETKQKIKR